MGHLQSRPSIASGRINLKAPRFARDLDFANDITRVIYNAEDPRATNHPAIKAAAGNSAFDFAWVVFRFLNVPHFGVPAASAAVVTALRNEPETG